MGTWDPWANPNYYWVVICKNTKFHQDTNLMFGHKIPLGETDAFESLPVSGPFLAKCDECGGNTLLSLRKCRGWNWSRLQASPHIPDSPEHQIQFQ